MAVAVGTGTTSGSSSSNVSYGNLFSEAVTAIGTGLSKLVPEEEELQSAGETFLVGLMPDLLSGSLIDITAGVVGGGLALGAGLLFGPEELIAAGFAAAITLAAGKYITEQELNQKASKKSKNGNGSPYSYHNTYKTSGGRSFWVTTASGEGYYGVEQQHVSLDYGKTLFNGRWEHIGKVYVESAHRISDYGRTIRDYRSLISPDYLLSKGYASFNYGKSTAGGTSVDTLSRSYSDSYGSLDYGRTKTNVYDNTLYTKGQKSHYGITDTSNYGKTTSQTTGSSIYIGPARTAVLVSRPGSSYYDIPGTSYAYNPVASSWFIDHTTVTRTSSDYGKTISYKRTRTGPQRESTFNRSVDYGKSRSYEQSGNGSEVYGSTIDYGATKTYAKYGAHGTSLYEASRDYGATKTYESGHTYERSLSYGRTKTYRNGRTYERSSDFGQTSTYSNGVTSYHAINAGQTFTYRNGVNYTHSIQGGRTFTRENGSTSLKSRNSGASFTETMGNGLTREHSIHSGATFTESKNGGATFLHESGGGRSYTYVHSGVEVMGRNYGQSYLYHNGAGVDFAYSSAIGGTYFGGSATQVGNGSVARRVLGLTANANLPVL